MDSKEKCVVQFGWFSDLHEMLRVCLKAQFVEIFLSQDGCCDLHMSIYQLTYLGRVLYG